MANNRIDNIFKQYSSALRGFIKKQIFSDDESEDILQDIFYRFIITDGEEEQIDNVSAWLYKVARNLIIDRSKKHKEERMPYVARNSEQDQESLIPISELLLQDDNTPESELARMILEEELDNALQELPEEQRTVYQLNELQGIQFAEISEATGIPINTLLSRKRYAVKFLRKRLSYLYE